MNAYNEMDYLTLARVGKEIEKRYKHYQERMCDEKFSFLTTIDKVEIMSKYSELGTVLAMIIGFMNEAEYNDKAGQIIK